MARYRKSLIEERAREITQILKSARRGQHKAGQRSFQCPGHCYPRWCVEKPTLKKLAELADPRVRASWETLARTLNGVITAHQRWLLGRQLNHLACLDREIAVLDREVAACTRPFEEVRKLLHVTWPWPR